MLGYASGWPGNLGRCEMHVVDEHPDRKLICQRDCPGGAFPASCDVEDAVHPAAAVEGVLPGRELRLGDGEVLGAVKGEYEPGRAPRHLVDVELAVGRVVGVVARLTV